MKKTLFLLLAIPGLAVADTETTVTAPSALTMHEVTFNGATTLTASNQAMTWDGTNAYNAWYMETILPVSTGDVYQASITAGPGGNNSSGLSVSSKNGWVTIGKGHQTVYNENNALSFNNTHLLTFAYYNGEAYMGNLITGEYIKCTPTGVTTTMTSGTSRAWSNGGATQIGATKIASLDGISTDIVTLVTQGTNTAAASGAQFYAVGTSQTGSTALVVNSGSATGWTGAFGNAADPGKNNNDLTLTGSVAMRFTDAFEGKSTAFGIVNAGAVTGDVSLFFDAEGASYGSFTDTNGASVVGAYKGKIGGTFRAVINAGTFENDIYGGIHTGATSDSVGATAITVNGGTITGNVYAGGCTGSITGDTSVTITSLTPFASHTANNIISAGGVGGTIGGDSTVTLSGIENGSYAGTVSGGANVAGSSTLNVASSQVAVGALTDFDRISLTGNSTLQVSGKLTADAGLSIEGGAGGVTLSGDGSSTGGVLSIASGNSLTLAEGSGLTVNGAIHNDGVLNNAGTLNMNITSAEGITATYNPAELTRNNNGLGSGVVEGLISGNGQFVNTGTITYNGNNVDLDSATGKATLDNAIYYVMAPQGDTDAEGYSYSVDGTFTGEYNEQGNPVLVDRRIKSGDVVYVGVHTYPGPIANDDANNALGFYVGKDGILGILADSNTMTTGQMLTQVQGDGTIILRAPGTENESDAQNNKKNFEAHISGTTQFTGALYTDPKLINSGNAPTGTKSVLLHLSEGADISSFSSINIGNNVHFEVNGALSRANETVGHFNNVTGIGSAATNFNFNIGSAGHYVFGGDTKLNLYWFGTDYPLPDNVSGASIIMRFLDDVTVDIEHLTSEGSFFAGGRVPVLELTNGDFGSRNSYLFGDPDYVGLNFNSQVNIDSFDFRGQINMFTRHEGSLHVNLNLLDNQYLLQSQYYAEKKAGGTATPSMTITGTGTYILTEGNSLLDNVGRVSEEFDADGNRIWQGTVEVNRLVALDSYNGGTTKNGFNFAHYGNEASTVHLKGFKGYLYGGTIENNAHLNIQIAQNLILTNVEADAANDKPAMNAFEISDGFTDQVQTYTGDISGDGDFVVSSDSNMTFNIQGDVSEWKDGAEFKVTNGTQSVNFSGKATEINADVLATGGTMNATISNDNAVAVNGEVKAQGGALNMTVSTAQGTTFAKGVAVSSLTVSDNSAAHLQTTSKAGKIQIDKHGQGATSADLSNGLTIADSTVSGGHIENAAITHLQAGGTVLLEDLTASNLYLYGDGINFSAQADQSQFTYTEQNTYGSLKVNEVVFNTSVLNGMTLSQDGARLGLTVNNNIAASTGDITWSDAHQISVTIHLKGFTIEKLTDSSGDWDWDANGLSIHPMANVALMDDTADVTVADLLTAEYDFVVYEQNLDGLTIRMYNIPEPTTATLSLLALAALAARRRRR